MLVKKLHPTLALRVEECKRVQMECPCAWKYVFQQFGHEETKQRDPILPKRTPMRKEQEAQPVNERERQK